MSGWEAWQSAVYGSGGEAWRYARTSAWVLTGQHGPRVPLDPWHATHAPHAEGRQHRTWALATDLLALAAWRGAAEHGVPLEDAPLLDVAQRLAPARVHQLHTGAYPPDTPGWAPRWRGILRRGASLARMARDVARRQLAAAARDDVPDPADTEPGMPPALWGDRVRAARATGSPGSAPAWRNDADTARARVDRAITALATGAWTPAAGETLAVTQLQSLAPARGSSGRSGGWLPRLRSLAGAEASLTAVASRPSHEPHTGDRPLASVLTSARTALDTAVTLAGELDQVWARRPAGQSTARWERQHLPAPLRTQILDLEDLLAAVEQLMRRIGARPR
ncbi:hypothetical protein [Streptomyces sp. SBT349]|uniref:hypothetical protein n=1 Tax=Streptomyces sp. SBT349 TaxID=1580539 RepID=UPI00066ED9A4|nr:hypothetical protein [Streptomyces sp. SBT349]